MSPSPIQVSNPRAWISAHKRLLGHLFTLLTGAALLYHGKYSTLVATATGLLSTFLYGGGYLESDDTTKALQQAVARFVQEFQAAGAASGSPSGVPPISQTPPLPVSGIPHLEDRVALAAFKVMDKAQADAEQAQAQAQASTQEAQPPKP